MDPTSRRPAWAFETGGKLVFSLHTFVASLPILLYSIYLVRYILWCMEKFRNGLPVEEFAHELKPKKKIRGWGPAVQNGKRIRSRRVKN